MAALPAPGLAVPRLRNITCEARTQGNGRCMKITRYS
jgi:hypothetical protein